MNLTAVFRGAVALVLAAPLAFLIGCSGASAPPDTQISASNGSESKAVESPASVSVANAADIEQLLNDAKGSVVVMNFWATWCPPCVEEMPHFVELAKSYKGKALKLISISADAKDSIEKSVEPFVEKQALPFPVHVLDNQDPDALSTVLGKELSGALPETIVYGKDGKIVKVWEGEVTLDELREVVDPLL